MTLQGLNGKTSEEVQKLLFQCCGSDGWVDMMMQGFPFSSERGMVEKATTIWYEQCSEADWRAAFAQHPKIGDVESLSKKFASTQHLAGKEQEGVKSASKEVIQRLADANTAYEERNGFIFIVCATGKSANEMLRLLEDRLKNSREEEVRIAMGEQQKITIIRLKKLLSEGNWKGLNKSQLTTHVLDTSIGRPGKDMAIQLQEWKHGKWQTVTQGVTNEDGRIADLLPPGRRLEMKNYRMVFDTRDYFERNQIEGFYPKVEIQFKVYDERHYHVPLLINPFGYSTYRGS